MKQELQNKLFAKYPSLFRERFLSPSETCMCWGISVGNGWYDIIDDMCRKIIFSQKVRQDIRFTKIKEKFAYLRVYCNEIDEEVEKIIEYAEYESGKTCEFCGTKILVKQRYLGYYKYTMCLKCFTEYIIKKKLGDFIWSIKWKLTKLTKGRYKV